MAAQRIPVGLQLYSVREDCNKDFPAVLSTVAKMGYAGVEFAGYYDYSAADLRKMLDDLGLKAAGTHTGLDTLSDDAIAKTVEFNQTLGNKFLIVPAVADENFGTRDAVLALAERFNRIAEALKPHGMLTGYHNHMKEFQALDGETIWDIFFSNTTDDVVMQFDTGNAMHAGGKALDYLKRYPGRAKSVHLKEFSGSNSKALIGEGEVPFVEIMNVCETTGGTEWYIVEQESYAYPPMECVDRCLKAIHALGR